MNGFLITTTDGEAIRFGFYNEAAPHSVAAFRQVLPFSIFFYHARTSGQEFWVANAFEFNIIQENASVVTEPGEVVLGPAKPARAKAMAGSIGIYYGEGRGLDAANIFAKVYDADITKLKALGEQIWKCGQQELHFSEIV